MPKREASRAPYLAPVLLAPWLAVAPIAASAAPDCSSCAGTGLVHSIVAAPVVPDGDVAGRPTDFVINLDASLDPEVPGRGLAAGDSIRITLPPELQQADPPLPFATLFAEAVEGCKPFPAADPALLCNTVVLLQGWPQHPVAPPPALAGRYETRFEEATNTLVVTALDDIVPAAPANPGIKQIHLLLNGFRNPRPGRYPVVVEADTGPGGARESGCGTLVVSRGTGPHLGVTSTGNTPPPFASPLFQSVPAGGAPDTYNLLLWGRRGGAMTGVELMPVALPRSDFALLVRHGRVVGQVSVAGPPGAAGRGLLSSPGPSALERAPVTGVPTARLRLDYLPPPIPGDYVVSVSLAGGDEAVLRVTVEE